MRAKVVKVHKLDYIRPREVISGTNFFSMDTGETDIRMVYNGTSCGLNTYCTPPILVYPPSERPSAPYYRVSASVTSTFRTSF